MNTWHLLCDFTSWEPIETPGTFLRKYVYTEDMKKVWRQQLRLQLQAVSPAEIRRSSFCSTHLVFLHVTIHQSCSWSGWRQHDGMEAAQEESVLKQHKASHSLVHMIHTVMYMLFWLHVSVGSIHVFGSAVFFCMWLTTNLCMSRYSCVVHPKHNMWPWLEVDYFNCLKIRKCLHPLALPLLVNSAENKWSLMAFFEFLVRGAAVSVFHGSQWLWPRQSGMLGWEIRGLDLSGCTLYKVCAW